jgi:hypothetical protein
MAKFSIELDDKPALLQLFKTDKAAFKEVVGTFVSMMELAAEKNWVELPKAIHSSISFKDVVSGVLNAVMTTREIDPQSYATLESDLHPLALLSDQRKNLISGAPENYDWKSHFALDTENVSRETIEQIIRKILYVTRWLDIESVSKALVSNQFPVVDDKDIRNLPFQPALMYQRNHLGELHVGKFFHDIGAFDCGTVSDMIHHCPACVMGDLEDIHIGSTMGDEAEIMHTYKVCPRCNAGFKIEGN